MTYFYFVIINWKKRIINSPVPCLDIALLRTTKTDELNVSVAVARGRHFGSLFPSTRRRRFHQARVIYYSNSCATFNLEYLLTCGDVQANPGPGRNSSGRPCSDNHQTSKNILRCMSLNARSICSKLNEFYEFYEKLVIFPRPIK